MKISLVINADTRPEKSESAEMFNGTRSRDYLIAGVANKILFLKGFDVEVILWVDEHEPLTESQLSQLRLITDRLVISRHCKYYRESDPFEKHNDLNYLGALSLARGDYIVHFDQDMGAFTRGMEFVQKLFAPLNEGGFHYVSYPSPHSPNCTEDPSFNHRWASTRFFICRREVLDFTKIELYLRHPEMLWATREINRKCPWTEHILGILAEDKVFYPPLSNDLLIFPWQTYKSGLLESLNSQPFDEIVNKLAAAGANTYHGCEGHRVIA